MESLLKADIFFFISALGTIILVTFLVIALVYLIRLVRTAQATLEEFRTRGGEIEKEAQEILSSIRRSTIFRFLFRTKKK